MEIQWILLFVAFWSAIVAYRVLVEKPRTRESLRRLDRWLRDYLNGRTKLTEI